MAKFKKPPEKIVVNGNEYHLPVFWYDKHSQYYSNDKVVPSIICGNCKNEKFQISYGEYECFGTCKCGNIISLYSG